MAPRPRLYPTALELVAFALTLAIVNPLVSVNNPDVCAMLGVPML